MATDRQYRMTNTPTRRTRLPRGQANEALHTHNSPAWWQEDGPSPKDERLRVYRCQSFECPSTMTHPL